MRLSTQADYAVRCVYELARHPVGTVVQTREIALAHDVPESYLVKVVQALARAGLVRTVRGNQGGVMLTRPPEQVSVLEVCEAIEGPIEFHRCVLRGHSCGDGVCPTHDFWEHIETVLRQELAQASFASLVERTLGSERAAATSMRR